MRARVRVWVGALVRGWVGTWVRARVRYYATKIMMIWRMDVF